MKPRGCIDQLPNGRLRLRMAVGGRQETIGVYDTREEAERAREAAPHVPKSVDIAGSGFVYFIQAGRGPIKIGFATDVFDRRAALQTSQPEHLRIVAKFAGTRQDERAMQARFAALRVRGEWFRPEDELLAFLASLGGRVDGRLTLDELRATVAIRKRQEANEARRNRKGASTR